MEKLFELAATRQEVSCPPIWMMRQAGRYQKSYMAYKEKFTFEQMCKLCGPASDIAMLPIKEFDFDCAILFSDILFHVEALGLPLHFDPGPKFEVHLNEENFEDYSFVPNETIKHLDFQSRALQATREKLDYRKTLLGFVGGPWTLMNYAIGDNTVSDEFKFTYIEKNIIPLLRWSIQEQLSAGADYVMIFDSGLNNISQGNFVKKYIPLLQNLSSISRVGYYSKNLPYNTINKVCNIGFDGIGIDSSQDLNKTLNKVDQGFIQGNFDETLMLLDSESILKHEIKKWLDTIEDPTGWVCGLGHGILKDTPTRNVRIFIETVRNHFR